MIKIKTDFVTNSSSSSFVVIGSQIDPSEISDERFKVCQSKHEDPLEHEAPLDRGEFESYIAEYIEYLTEGTDLEYSFGNSYGDGDLQVGICYTKMYENETLADFKDRVKKSIMDSLGIDVGVGHIEECWEDR